MTAFDDEGPLQRRVRVLFGQHVMATYVAEATAADRYATTTRRMFYGLEVLVDDEFTGAERRLPCERLWQLAP